MNTVPFLSGIVYIFNINQILCSPEATTTQDCPIGYEESDNFCYLETEETTFPYHCPLRYTEYFFPFSTDAWMNVQREPAYGFFPFPVLNNYHGRLLWSIPLIGVNDFEDCFLGNRRSTANCNDKHRGSCIYDKRDRQFCEAYDKICNTSQHNCHCQSRNVLYLCQLACERTNHQECSSCEQNFAQYPEPEIRLVFNGIDTFRADVIGPLKLIDIQRTGMRIYCFSTVYEADSITIRHIYALHLLDKETTTRWTYTFLARSWNAALGLNWCEGFTYDSHRKVVSNKIIAGVKSAYGLTFVVNATTNEFTITPFNLHSQTVWRLRHVLGSFNDRIQVIHLPEFPHLYNNRSTADMSIHITTPPHITNAEYELKEISQYLTNCESFEFRDCSVALADRCLPGTTSLELDLTVSWPGAFLGQRIMPREILLQENGLPITRRCLGRFMMGAYWSEVIGEVYARRGSSITDALYDLRNSNQTAEELNQKLRDIILNVKDFIPLDVYLVAKIFEIISQSGEDFDINVFVENMNIIMDSDSNILQLAQSELNATDIILYSFDIALATLAGNTTTTIISKNVMAQVTPLVKFGGITGIAVYHQKGQQMQMKNLTNVTMSSQVDFDGLHLAVFIPPELLNKIFAQTETPSLVTTVFFNDTLFRSKKNVGVSVINAIVGVFVTNFIGDHISESLPIIFASSSLAGRSMFCGYWKFGFNDFLIAIHGRWQKQELAKIYYRQFKTCSFNHMTHFAILANAPRNRVLDIISLVGCAISMLGVVGIMVTAMVFKSWRNCTATKILLNLSLTILIQMSLLFLSHVINTTRWCTILAISLQYIIVTQFSWMFIIGYLQYRKFVQVLVEEPAHLLLYSSIFAWITPILPVVIVFLLDKNSYMNPPYCFVTGPSLYFGVFLPVGCILVSNLTIFMLIFASLSCNKAQAFGTGQNNLLLRVRLSFVLFFLLGFSWIFGLLSYITKSIILSYLFCVTSTVQGFVLYVYFVVCNKRTRAFWARNILCCTKITSKSDSPFITKSK